MNMLQHLFGRRVGARCAPPAENAPGPKRKNATIHGLTPLLGRISMSNIKFPISNFQVNSQKPNGLR